MYYETTKELLDFIKKSPTAFHAVEEMQKQTDRKRLPGAFREGTLETGSGRKLCGHTESFGTDRLFHTGEGILEVPYHS